MHHNEFCKLTNCSAHTFVLVECQLSYYSIENRIACNVYIELWYVTNIKIHLRHCQSLVELPEAKPGCSLGIALHVKNIFCTLVNSVQHFVQCLDVADWLHANQNRLFTGHI